MPGWWKNMLLPHMLLQFLSLRKVKCFGIIPERLVCINLVFATVDRAITGRPNWGQKDFLDITAETEPLGFSAVHEVNA